MNDDSGRFKITEQDRVAALNREIIRTKSSPLHITPGMWDSIADSRRRAARAAANAAAEASATWRYFLVIAFATAVTAAVAIAELLLR